MHFNARIVTKKYTKEVQLKRHNVSAHQGNKLFECDHCDKSFSTKQNLITHNSNYHEDKNPFRCSHCDKRFPAEHNMFMQFTAKLIPKGWMGIN